jgi:hypothetical protein
MLTVEELFLRIRRGEYDVDASGLPKHPGRSPEWEKYRKEVENKKTRFKVDLLLALNIQDHPKAGTLWRIAWDYGHSYGYLEVAYYAEELVELLR